MGMPTAILYNQRIISTRPLLSLMTRTDLISHLALRRGYSETDMTQSVAVILSGIAAALAVGERVELRGFGSFCVKQRRSRPGRNPKTGDPINVPAKPVPHFKMGKELRERILNSGDKRITAS